MNKIKKMMMIAASLILVATASVNAQKATIVGRVVDGETGEGLPFVNVALMRSVDTVFMRGAATDMEGNFAIGDVDTGSYLMQASFVGYIPYYRDFKVGAASRVEAGTISLTRGTTLNEVQVVADKPIYLMDGEKNMYNTKEDPSIQTGTASDALQNAPGVEVDAEGNITLRGVSSVEIWINDQPSHMNEEALKQYIKTLPANAIERIEVITNPSARYSTSGGVINIVTNQKVTRNELLCFGVHGSTLPSVSPWVSYVWANEKVDFNIYLNGNYSMNEMITDGTATLLDENGDTSRFQDFKAEGRIPHYGGYAGLSFNWKIDSMTHLSAWMGAYPAWGQNNHLGDCKHYENIGGTRLDLGYMDTSRSRNYGGGAYAGAWLEHRFDTAGRKLSVNFNGNYWGSGEDADNWRTYPSAILPAFHRHSTTFYSSPHASMGVDYVLPLKNDIEIDFGAQVGFSHNTNDICLDSLDADGLTWNNIGLRSYSSQGTAWQPSAYVTAQKRWGGFTAKLGLRLEDTYEYGSVTHYSDAEPTLLKANYPGWVPSLHLSYQTKTFTSYSLSYTRRYADALDMMNISNFRIYDDESFRTGNPNLLRSYTHNLEAAWSKYLMGFGMVGLNGYWRANTNEQADMASATTDPYYFNGTRLVNYTYPVNIGSSHTEGVEANITYRPTGFLNVRFSASVFNYGYSYDGLDTNKVSFSTRINVWAKVWNKLELFANAHYSSPRLGLYSLSVANKGIDFGVSSDLLDRRLSLNLTVNDIFGWNEWGSNYIAPQYQTTGTQQWKSTFVSFGLTWRIGKMELESKARQGASDTGNTPQM